MNRHQLRENTVVCIYQKLVVKKLTSMNDIVKGVFDIENLNSLDTYVKLTLKTALENRKEYIGYINAVLNDYKYNRLGFMEQAILLVACAEFDLKETDANVIINEAVIIAKKYCDEDAYKLINVTLERL